jgi:hypothetical protein
LKSTNVILPPPEIKPEPEKEPELLRILPFSNDTKWPIPGFQRLIAEINVVFDVHDLAQIDTAAATSILEREERFLVRHFVAGYRSIGQTYCPIGVEVRNAFPDLHSASGLETFRLSSREEIRDQARWREYLKSCQIYRYKARLYQSVFVIAALRAAQEVRGVDSRMAGAVDFLENGVRGAIMRKTMPSL